jgi:lysozyme
MKAQTKKILIVSSIVIVILMATSLNNSAYAKAEAFIKKGEGLNLNAYLDSGGVWTIGYGSIFNYEKNRPVQQGDKITLQQAQRWLNIEMDKKAAAIKELIKVPQNNNQIAALISFAYNVGVNGFENSTLLKNINANKPKPEIEAQFMRWVYDNGKKVTGLVNRRANEVKLYFS